MPEFHSIFLLGMGIPYPDPDARLRNIHALQMSENYVVVPETSYLYDPCTKIYRNASGPSGWLQEYDFVDSYDSVIQVLRKTGEHVGSVKIDSMFTTHMLGCFEDNEENLLHVDFLKYKDASSYTHYTFIDNAIDGQDYPDGLVQVTHLTYSNL